MLKNPSTRQKSVSRASGEVDTDGKPIGNLLLRGLSRTECSQIYSSLELVRLKLHQLLHEAGETIHSVYFLNDGLASVLTVQSDGGSVEVGLIGKEGFVGVPVIFGFKTSNLRVVTQGDGTAYRIDVQVLRRLLANCPGFAQRMQRFSLLLAMQSTQLAACNRLHSVEERLARWLLMSHDRIEKKTLPLTQEFLAQMLGVRRASVSVAAGILQKAGLIIYTRGSVSILSRARLEEVSCDCYGMIEHQKRTWLAEGQTVPR
jgi:CRP-like cAMP-binding protein